MPYHFEDGARARLAGALAFALTMDNERLDTCELEMWCADLEPVVPSDECNDSSYPEVRVELSGNGGATCE